MRKKMEKVFGLLKEQQRDEQGAIMILMAFLIVILLGFAALVCDYGMVYYKNARLQNAVDAAARAASRRLAEDDETVTPIQKENEIYEMAKHYLSVNGFPESELEVCDIDINAEEGVSIDAKTSVPLSFARIFTEKDIQISSGATAITEMAVTKGEVATVDVVFVLDISSSMWKYQGAEDPSRKVYWERFSPMVDAVNQCIESIKGANSNNRVGVVVYGNSGTTKILMKLTKYPQEQSKIGGVTCENKGSVPSYIGRVVEKWDGGTIMIGGQDGYIKTSSGGTYTQYGVAVGSNMLKNCTDDGIKRLPVVFVLSDGEATHGTKKYNASLSVMKNAQWAPANRPQYSDVGYYTVLTACYWKKQLTEEYTERNDGVESLCRFYSLGLGLDGTDEPDYSKAVLQPKIFETLTPYTDNGWDIYHSLGKNPDYYYCDEYYDARNAEEMAEMLEQFATEVVEPIKTFSTRLTR